MDSALISPIEIDRWNELRDSSCVQESQHAAHVRVLSQPFIGSKLDWLVNNFKMKRPVALLQHVQAPKDGNLDRTQFEVKPPNLSGLSQGLHSVGLGLNIEQASV